MGADVEEYQDEKGKPHDGYRTARAGMEMEPSHVGTPIVMGKVEVALVMVMVALRSTNEVSMVDQ
jgi:hypothetical protein